MTTQFAARLEALTPTLRRYARAVVEKAPDLEPDDLAQDMALALLEQQATHPTQEVNDAYLKRCAWFARSASLQKTFTYRRHAVPLETETPDGDEIPLLAEDQPALEDLAIEAERLAALRQIFPTLQVVLRRLSPPRQQIVTLIMLDMVGLGDLPRATGLSASAISHHKKSIRQCLEKAGITRASLSL